MYKTIELSDIRKVESTCNEMKSRGYELVSVANVDTMNHCTVHSLLLVFRKTGCDYNREERDCMRRS